MTNRYVWILKSKNGYVIRPRFEAETRYADVPAQATFYHIKSHAEAEIEELGLDDVEIVRFLIYNSPIAGEQMLEASKE
jgi:hypothetical protein